MGNVLAMVEERDGRLLPVSGEVVSAAAHIAEELGSEVHALLVGPPGLEEEAKQLGAFGAARVKVAADQALAAFHPEVVARVVEGTARAGGYAAVVLSGTSRGKDLAPRVAVRLDLPLAQDVTAISVEDGVIELVRPVYAGKALARVRLHASPALLTVRPNVFPARSEPGTAELDVVPVDLPTDSGRTRVEGFEAGSKDVPDVSEASVVVSGGRGLKGPEHWYLLEQLREALGDEAGLGASRAVVDAGWRPHSEQVGQTGKTVAPRLYFAVGLSGAIQHLAGMRTAGTIVAINKDPEAPIFRVADYGVVGDLFEIVPALTEEIRALDPSG